MLCRLHPSVGLAKKQARTRVPVYYLCPPYSPLRIRFSRWIHPYLAVERLTFLLSPRKEVPLKINKNVDFLLIPSSPGLMQGKLIADRMRAFAL
jgi:hypothetical protein